MSYCVLPHGLPKTKKLMFVFWFRVRAAALDRAMQQAKDWLDHGGTRDPLIGTIPLISLGAKNYIKNVVNGTPRTLATFDTQNYFWIDGGTSGPGWYPSGDPGTSDVTTEDLIFSGQRQTDPSYIGIDCFGEYPALSINLALPPTNVATYGGTLYPKGALADWNTTLFGNYGGGGVDPGAPSYYLFAPDTPYQELNMDIVNNGPIPGVITATLNYGESQGDVVFGSRPEIFRTRPAVGYSLFTGNDNTLNFFKGRGLNGPKVVPDQWHSVCFSIDVTQKVKTDSRFLYERSIESRMTGQFDIVSQSGDTFDVDPYDDFTKYVKSTAKMFLAFDDENLTGPQMSVYAPPKYIDKNGVLTVNAYEVGTTTIISSSSYTQPRLGIANDFTDTKVRGTYSLEPKEFEFNTPIGFPATSDYVDQITEVQMGGLRIYTDDAPDWSNLDARRAFVTKDGKPASNKAADDYMGKRPEFWMPKRRNFMIGKNDGTYHGTDAPEDKGTVVSDVDPFRPDPSLYGSQKEIPLKK